MLFNFITWVVGTSNFPGEDIPSSIYGIPGLKGKVDNVKANILGHGNTTLGRLGTTHERVWIQSLTFMLEH